MVDELQSEFEELLFVQDGEVKHKVVNRLFLRGGGSHLAILIVLVVLVVLAIVSILAILLTLPVLPTLECLLEEERVGDEEVDETTREYGILGELDERVEPGLVPSKGGLARGEEDLVAEVQLEGHVVD